MTFRHSLLTLLAVLALGGCDAFSTRDAGEVSGTIRFDGTTIRVDGTSAQLGRNGVIAFNDYNSERQVFILLGPVGKVNPLGAARLKTGAVPVVHHRAGSVPGVPSASGLAGRVAAKALGMDVHSQSGEVIIESVTDEEVRGRARFEVAYFDPPSPVGEVELSFRAIRYDYDAQ